MTSPFFVRKAALDPTDPYQQAFVPQNYESSYPDTPESYNAPYDSAAHAETAPNGETYHPLKGGESIYRGMVLHGTSYADEEGTNDQDWDPGVVNRIQQGTATAHDILSHGFDGNDPGDYWHHPEHGSLDDAKGYAEVESDEHPANEDMQGYGRDANHSIGSMGVILEGAGPKGWDPEKTYDEQDDDRKQLLMGNSFLPYNTQVPLKRVHYHDMDGNWHSADATGHTLNVATNPNAPKLSFFVRQSAPAQDYMMDHRPPTAENGAPAHDLTANGVYPDDVYTHPEYYGEGNTQGFIQTKNTLRRIRGNPEAPVNIFRSSPSSTINPGDWVSLSHSYAAQHGMHPTDPSQDLPVYKQTVKAKDIHTDGNSLDEFGYNGAAPLQGVPSVSGGTERQYLAFFVRKANQPSQYTLQLHQQHGDAAALTPGPMDLYHGTKSYHADSITQNGLRPSSNGESGAGVYLTPNLSTANKSSMTWNTGTQDYAPGNVFHTKVDPGRLLNRNHPGGEAIFQSARQDTHYDGQGSSAILKSLGYDGVSSDHAGQHEVVLFDPSKVSQLNRYSAVTNPTTINWARNKKQAPSNTGLYDQDIEPAGPYVTEHDPNGNYSNGNYEFGTTNFQNPIHMQLGEYGTPSSWKQQLSKQFGGATGHELSQSLLKAGHDGVITHDKYGTGEILDLTRYKAPRYKAPGKMAFFVRKGAEPQFFYRLHHQDRPFSPEDATSASLADPSQKQPGYSAFSKPSDLVTYLKKMGWDSGERTPKELEQIKSLDQYKPDTAIRPTVDAYDPSYRVIKFQGTQIGKGVDGEPLVMPQNSNHESTDYKSFIQNQNVKDSISITPPNSPFDGSSIPEWKRRRIEQERTAFFVRKASPIQYITHQQLAGMKAGDFLTRNYDGSDPTMADAHQWLNQDYHDAVNDLGTSDPEDLKYNGVHPRDAEFGGPDNYLKSLKDDIAQNGMKTPLEISGDTVQEGHHRGVAALQLKMDKIPVIYHPVPKTAFFVRKAAPQGLTFEHVPPGQQDNNPPLLPVWKNGVQNTPDDEDYQEDVEPKTYLEHSRIKAIVDGKPIGYMDLHPSGEINMIEVHPNFHRQGIGNAMFQHAKSLGLNPQHSTDLTPSGREFAQHVAKTWDGSKGDLTFQYTPPTHQQNSPGANEQNVLHRLDAYVNGNKVGYMKLNDGNGRQPHGLIDMVSTQMRNQGIGRALGEHFRDEIGIQPIHSDIHSASGLAFAQAIPEWPTWNGKRVMQGKPIPKPAPAEEQMSMFGKKAWFVRKAANLSDYEFKYTPSVPQTKPLYAAPDSVAKEKGFWRIKPGDPGQFNSTWINEGSPFASSGESWDAERDWLGSDEAKQHETSYDTDHVIDAIHKPTGQLAGRLSIGGNRPDDQMYDPNQVTKVDVVPAHRGIGLSKAMYDHATSLGIPWQHSSLQTPDGAKMLKKHFSLPQVPAVTAFFVRKATPTQWADAGHGPMDVKPKGNNDHWGNTPWTDHEPHFTSQFEPLTPAGQNELTTREKLSPFDPKEERFMGDPLWAKGYGDSAPTTFDLKRGTPATLDPRTPLISSQPNARDHLVNRIREEHDGNYSGIHVMQGDNGIHTVLDGHNRLLADRLEGLSTPVTMHTPDELDPKTRQQFYSFFVRTAAPYAGNPAAPLPFNPGKTFYRVHPGVRRFSPENAQSAPMNDDLGVWGGKLPGYSSFDNPHDLHRYLNHMGWDDNGKDRAGYPALYDPHQFQVVQYNGSVVGKGVDEEPLSLPNDRASRTTMSYPDFKSRLAVTPHPDVAQHFHYDENQKQEFSSRPDGYREPEYPGWKAGNGADCTTKSPCAAHGVPDPYPQFKHPIDIRNDALDAQNAAEGRRPFPRSAFFVRKAVQWQDTPDQQLTFRYAPSAGSHKNGNEFPAEVNAMINGEHAGSLMFQPKGDNHYHPGEISDMAVFSPYKGKGIGRAMIQHAIEQSGAPVYHSEQLTDEGKPFSTGTPEFAAPPGLKQQFRDYYNNTNEPLENFQYKPPVTAFFVRKSDAPAWNQWLGDNHPTQQLFPQVPIEQVAALRGHGQFKSDAEVNALATDIKQNGMTNPISMSMRRGWTKDSTGKRYFSETPTPFFEDGHHRLQAAGRAGLTHVPVMMFNGETTEGNQAAMDYDDKAYADSRKFFDSHQDLVKQEQDKINNRPTGPQSPWPPPPLNKNAWFVRKANAWTQNGRVQTLSHPSGLSGTVGPSMIPGAGFMGAINHPTAGTVHIKNYPTEDEAKSAVTGQLDSGQFANAQKVAPPAMTPRPISAPTKQSVPLYHGTTQENLTQVLPATQHGGNVVFPHETDHSYAYATPNLDDAWEYAEKAWHATSEGIPRVYQVSSINGDEEPDPQQRADQSFRGNNENDLRSSTGFDVHHEMPMPEHMGTPEEWGDTGSDFRTSATQMMNPADLWSHTRDLSLPHQQSKVNDLAQSIQQNGYQADWADRPIHVSWDNPEGTPDISDGNHRLRAMEQAGYNQPIPVHTAFFVRVAGPRINPYTDELEDENPQPGAFQADRSITGPGHPLRMLSPQEISNRQDTGNGNQDTENYNAKLRNPAEDEVDNEFFDHLDHTIRNSPLPQATELHRGMSITPKNPLYNQLQNPTPGTTITHEGFPHTSSDPNVPAQFATKGLGEGTRHHFHIQAPAGFPAYQMPYDGKNDSYSSESEYLLPRNTSFTILKSEQDASGIQHHTVVPSVGSMPQKWAHTAFFVRKSAQWQDTPERQLTFQHSTSNGFNGDTTHYIQPLINGQEKMPDGKPVGYMRLNGDTPTDGFTSKAAPGEILGLNVHPELRGTGLARAMGQYAQSQGMQVVHSPQRTKDGDQFAKSTPEFGTVKRKKLLPSMGATNNDSLINSIRGALSDDLLKPEYRNRPDRLPSAGHCYAASEAAYHMLGGKAAGWTPMNIRHEGDPHWFLKHQDGTILDPTADQFQTPVPYDQARGKGFLTAQPSKRAQSIIDRIQSPSLNTTAFFVRNSA